MRMNSDSFHMPCLRGITSSNNRQYPETFMANKCLTNPISSTAESVNAIATDFNAKFYIAQSNMTRAQEQNLSNSFNYCQGFIQ